MSEEKYTNDLINETSPYLLQHAHNPVNWIAWSEEVFKRAKEEGKMVLISVGYSACHWCHVMEHECFEDEEVATLMNKFFINVKVDREERPDVDQVYMTAVQLMTQRGGWPLNCFTLPDGRPIYGGTYFPKEQWMNILRSLQYTFLNEREKVEEYAEKLTEGVQQSELINTSSLANEFTKEHIDELVLRWSKSFDWNEGGTNRAPKFPLPNNYEFLLNYGVLHQSQKCIDFVKLTLDKMAMGGIYDQVGGGFARYSVDVLWKVPHFEKMLYDNGQLLTLYANAYKFTQKKMYKDVLYQTFDWLEREMRSGEGSYLSALDADSEGEEGKFYCWSKDELRSLLGQDFDWVQQYYNINERGYWEDEKYILLKRLTDEQIALQLGWDLDTLQQNVNGINQLLLDERSHRIRPGLDDKQLTSWNALTISGLCKAYEAFREAEFKQAAIRIAKWIVKNQLNSEGKLMRNRKNQQSKIDGFLEDYATTIEAFIHLYQITFDEEWLEMAKNMLEFTIHQFSHEESQMFYFVSSSSTLIARKMEINDNVIPSSNSIMAKNLFLLGSYYANQDWVNRSKQMLYNVMDGMETYGSGYSNWAQVYLIYEQPFYELTCNRILADKLAANFLPNCLLVDINGTLPIVQGKKEEENIYICTEGTCLPPLTSIDEVLKTVIQ